MLCYEIYLHKKSLASSLLNYKERRYIYSLVDVSKDKYLK